MKLVNIGLASALLVLTAGISGCNSDEPPPEVKPVAAAPVVAAKPVSTTSTATTLAMQDPVDAEDSEYADDGSPEEPGVFSSYSPESEHGGVPTAGSGTAGTGGTVSTAGAQTAGVATTTKSTATAATGTSTTSGSTDVGGNYGGSALGVNGVTGVTGVTGAAADTAASTPSVPTRDTLLARAQTFSTHLLLTGLTAANGTGQTLTYDAYFPVGYRTATTGPFVFVIHGGDWTEGAKEDVKTYAVALAQRGFVAIAPNYRLAPANPHPAQVNDISDMMKYIENNPSTLFTTGTYYGAVGIAAGGHLASLVALSPNSAGHVKCVANVFAQTDLTNLPTLDASIKKFLGDTYSPAKLIETSPVFQIAAHVGTPSFYLSHGTADVKVPVAQSQAFAAALKQGNLSVTLTPVEGAGHGYSDDQTKSTATDVATFMASCLAIQ